MPRAGAGHGEVRDAEGPRVPGGLGDGQAALAAPRASAARPSMASTCTRAASQSTTSSVGRAVARRRRGPGTGRAPRGPTRTPRTGSAARRPARRARAASPAASASATRGAKARRAPGRVARHPQGVGPGAAQQRRLVADAVPDDPLDEPRAVAAASPRRSMSSPCVATRRTTAARSPATACARAAGSQARSPSCAAATALAADRRRGPGCARQHPGEHGHEHDLGRRPHPTTRDEHADPHQLLHDVGGRPVCAGRRRARRRSAAVTGARSSTAAAARSASSTHGGSSASDVGPDPVRGRGAGGAQRRDQVDVRVTTQRVPGEVHQHRPAGGELGDPQRGLGVGDAVLVRAAVRPRRTA